MIEAVSLFSSVGGLDLGLHKAGIVHRALCEADPYRRDVLRRHWPTVPIYDDVRTFDYDSPVDLIVGGFPCQDLSQAGKRAGLSGERSGLFYEFARIAERVVRPGGVLLAENVSGLLTSNGGRDMLAVCNTLAESGFDSIAYRTLDSQYFGVPHRRRRVFIVAQRAESELPGKVLALAEGGSRDLTSSRETRNNGSRRSLGIVRDACEQLAFHHTQDPISGPISPSLSKNADGMGVLAFMTGEESERVLRRLTPVECERLQAWPDGWTIPNGPSLLEAPRWFEDGYVPDESMPAPDGRRYAACGDGVTATVAEWIGSRLVRAYLSESCNDCGDPRLYHFEPCNDCGEYCDFEPLG